MERLKRHGNTIVIVVAVIGAIAFSQYRLGNVYNQLIAMQGQVSKNQAALDAFIQAYIREHDYLFGENETPADEGSADE